MPCVYHWVDGCAHEVTKLYEDETGIWIVITCYPDDEFKTGKGDVDEKGTVTCLICLATSTSQTSGHS